MVGNDTARDTERDLRTILLVQAIRAFLYGLGSVLIGLTLADGGFTDAEVGLVFAAMLVGMAVSSVVSPSTLSDLQFLGDARLEAASFPCAGNDSPGSESMPLTAKVL